MSKNKLRITLLDIETSPMISWVWGLFDQNIGLNQIKKDWHILSFAAKELGAPVSKVIYHDQSKEKNIEDDRKLLAKVWKILDESDILITQNGVKFDIKKLNARFIQHGFKPYSSLRHIDTLKLARKYFAFTSNKLEYMTDRLCTKYKKLKHKKFSGFELWKACMAGNKEAWKEMRKYNMYDIFSLEELYNKLIPWDNSINFNVYHDGLANVCKCGSTEFRNKGYRYSNAGKYSRFKCKSCGAETVGRDNLLSKEKRKSLRK